MMQGLPRTAIDMAALLDQRQISSVALCEALLDRIEERDGTIGAWAHLNPDISLRDALAADKRAARGQRLSALDGVPIGIKDNIDTADFPTELGSPIHAGRRPKADAAMVQRLKRLGLVVLGKTVTTPFGMNAAVPTLNPAYPGHTLGASSVGSAAAVAAGMVPLTLNTQNTSSTTRPACYAGLCAFKPTHGVLPLDGTFALSPPVTHPAFMATSLADLECLAQLLLPPRRDNDTGQLPTLAVVKGPWWNRAEPEAASRFEAFAAEKEIGRTVDLPPLFERALDAHLALIAGDMAVTMADEYAQTRAMLPEEAIGWIERGRGMTAMDYVAALRLRDTLYAALDKAMADVDVLMTLATPGPAPRIADGLGDGTFSMPWTFCGAPTLTLPRLDGPHGLPLAVQLIARRHADFNLFKFSKD